MGLRATFKSASAAGRTMGKKDGRNITAVCTGGQLTAYGYAGGRSPSTEPDPTGANGAAIQLANPDDDPYWRELGIYSSDHGRLFTAVSTIGRTWRAWQWARALAPTARAACSSCAALTAAEQMSKSATSRAGKT